MKTGKTLLLSFATLVLLCSLSFRAGASHIVGGELTYQCLGNNYYEVTLTLYRDNCASGSINMPLSLDFELVELPGTYVSTHQVFRGPSTYISPNSVGCGTPTPNVCVESAEYVLDSLYLPPSSNGYMIYHQQCCRNTAVDNVVNAWQQGLTAPAYIYNPGACNNSPVFNAYPPVVLPTGVPLAMPAGATDPDADSLYHEFCTPLGSQNTSPPFSLVPWAAGYSSGYQVPSNPALSIDPTTGVVYGTISQNGKFSVGICVSEYRNGVMIGKTRRDYQFVSIAPWTVFASIQSQTSASCGSGGSATAAAGGGQGPYSFLWSNGQTGATASNLPVGTHSVIVTGSGGCKDTAFVTISGSGGGLSLNLSSQSNIACNAGSGAATVAASGGSAPYSYLWSDGSTGATHNNLPAGNHSVTVSDAGGCSATLNISITASGGPSLQLDSTQSESCPGAADGFAQLSTSGGTAPYTYSWSNGANTEDISNLSAGSYTLVVTDSNGCSDSLLVNIAAGNGLSIDSIYSLDESCPGAGDGEIEIFCNQAAASFSWSDGASGAQRNGLSPGSYTVVVSNASGCSDSAQITIATGSALQLSVDSIKSISCHGSQDGYLALSTQGGVGPYTYQWNNITNLSARSNLAVGSYYIVVTDSRGCYSTDTFTISAPDSLQISTLNLQQPACGGANNGNITLSVSGGTAPYSFSWSNGGQDSILQNAGPGSYTFTVSDANGCTNSRSFNLQAPTGLGISLDSLANAACGQANGYASLSISGGSAPYSYQWSNGLASAINNSLPAGNAWVVVSDALGCSDSLNFNVANTANLVVQLDSASPAGCGQPNGFASLKLSGGTAPFSYNWSNGGTQISNSNLSSGNAWVVVSDASGCSDSLSFNVGKVVGLKAQLDSSAATSCGQSNGFASLKLSGGSAPYTYSWSNGLSTATNSSLPSGPAWVVVSGAAGCRDSLAFYVTASSPILIQLDSSTAASCGQANGFASLSISGGSAPFSYQWSNGLNTASNSSLPSGAAWVLVSDATGCSDSLYFNVSNLAGLSVQLDSIKNNSCFGANDGYLAVSAAGGSAPYSYQWTNSSSLSVLNNLAAGTYGLTITDSQGCSLSTSYTISAPDSLEILQFVASDVSCNGAADGSIMVQIGGGQRPYSYSWSNGQTDSLATGLTAGTHILQISDAAGCSFSKSFSISQPTAVVIAIDSIKAAGCGANNGFAQLSANGGQGPYSFVWSNGGLGAQHNNLGAGSYWVAVSDSNGCSDTLSFQLPSTSTTLATIDSTAGADCNGASYARVKILASGSFTVSWSDGSSGLINTQLPAGPAFAVVADTNGCSDSLHFNIPASASLNLSIVEARNPNCAGENSGAIEVNAAGGSAPYSYQWSHGAQSKRLDFLGAGVYNITVTDANGCSDSQSVTLVEPDSFVVAIDSLLQPTACGGDDGAVYLSVLNGDTIVAISAVKGKAGAANRSLTGLAGGSYNLMLTNSRGCVSWLQFELEQAEALRWSRFDISGDACSQGATFDVDVAVAGGSSPYQYRWSDGVQTPSRRNLPAGIYQLSVSDSNGCQLDSSIVLSNKSVEITTSLSAVPCGSDADALLELSVKGASTPYRIWLDEEEINFGQTPVQRGYHDIKVRDADGCEFYEQVYVEERLGGKIYFANAFTPNGDGINDVYKISGDETCYGHGRLEIYNRWGARVFVSDDPLSVFWDGKVEGQPAQSGIYTYIFTVDGYQQRGTINITR